MTDVPAEPASETHCPNCRQPMNSQEFARHDAGKVCVNLCFTCAGIWFDHLASASLAPSAVIELFKEIYDHRDSSPQPLASSLLCPRCDTLLSVCHDLGRAGRFSYFRCTRGDGRFTAFYQFLREKQFVRNLTPIELQRVRAEVRQIKCSECGAPIDLETMSECKFCHAPVSFLDPDAVQRGMQMWSNAEANRRAAPDPEAIAEALRSSHGVPRLAAPSAGTPLFGGAAGLDVAGAESAGDLIAMGIHAIGRLFLD